MNLAGGKEVHQSIFLLVTHDLLTRLELAPGTTTSQVAPGFRSQSGKKLDAIEGVMPFHAVRVLCP